MRTFSKSKILSLRQCQKRLWLEIHHPGLKQDSAQTEASYRIGHEVGEIARRIYDPDGLGNLIDIEKEGFAQAFVRSSELLRSSRPIFEAGFSANGALAFADVMLPVDGESAAWRMVEVKSSTGVKDYHRDDAAIQSFVARSAGVNLKSIALAHIDSTWTYQGDENYQGLLKENDLTDEAFSRAKEVEEWIAEAQSVAERLEEPGIDIGEHCTSPFECGFIGYCNRNEPQPEHPVHWLPRVSAAKVKKLASIGIHSMADVPDVELNEIQRRVKKHTISGSVYFDAEGAAGDLAKHPLPAYFLDFETIQLAVPVWKGTRPYQQIPFQFSLHILSSDGTLTHKEFLDLSGNDPSEGFAKALIDSCGDHGPVFTYNAGFEKARIRELADRIPSMAAELTGISDRVVDLLPIARERYYHPSQQGSWSIKKVLPALVPELRYEVLDGVQDGGMAMDAYQECVHPDTTLERKAEIERQLLAYCKLDTYAMVRMWQVFSSNQIA